MTTDKFKQKPLHQRNMVRGTIFAVISAMLWATASLAVKMSSEALSNIQVVWFGRLIGFIAFLPILLLSVKQKGWRSFKPHRSGLLALRALCSLLASYCFYYALRYLSLTTAVLESYTRPLWLPLIILVVYRKRLEPVIWFSLAIGFIGVILILEPGIDFQHPATLVGLASGLIGAVAALLVRRLAKAEPSDSITFHFFWMSLILSSIPVIFFWETPANTPWPWLTLLGILIALYQMCLSRAYRYLRASVAGAVLYTALIFSTIFDWVIWDNEPTLYTGLGILLICGSSILAVVLAKQPIVPP